MKILAYEVRDDEREHFNYFAEKYGMEVILTDQVPTLENADTIARMTDAAVASMVQCGMEGICSVIQTGNYRTLL